MGILEDLIIIIYSITHLHEYVLFTHYFLVLCYGGAKCSK